MKPRQVTEEQASKAFAMTKARSELSIAVDLVCTEEELARARAEIDRLAGEDKPTTAFILLVLGVVALSFFLGFLCGYQGSP